jgi:hypothetical protein
MWDGVFSFPYTIILKIPLIYKSLIMKYQFNLLIFFLGLFSLPVDLPAQGSSFPIDDESGLIMYREVVEEEGDKDLFFKRAVGWLNGFYANPVNVTKTRDPQTGLIKGLHRFKLKSTAEDGTQVDAGTMQYEFTLEFKEGRYRYTLTEFVLRQASRQPAEKWLNKTDPQSKNFLKQLDDFAQSWIASLKESMKPEPEKVEEEW